MPSKKAAILNSRQSLRPIGGDTWVVNTGRAVRHAADNNCTILTSTGMNSWEIILYFASAYDAYQIVYIPIEKGQSHERARLYYTEQFKLSAALTDWRFIEVENMKKDNHVFQKSRDESIINEADIIYPVSVRQNGNMGRLLKDRQNDKTMIRYDFRTDYMRADRKYKLDIDLKEINPKIDRQLKDYLIHWTRASNKPWPGESIFSFYDAVIHSPLFYAGSGMDTVSKILSDGEIIPSSRHYRKKLSAVAFSGLPPSKAAALMKWRTRYREMSFEPYGIAVKRKYGESLGIRKVVYGNPEEFYNLNDKERPFFQSTGTRGYWVPENEYRYIGQFDLNQIPEECITAIVWKPDEITDLKRVFNGRIVSFYK